MNAFLAAFNSGQEDLTTRYIAPDSHFRWFSTRDRINPAAGERDSLDDYLEVRQQRDVKQELAQFKFNGVSNGYGNFAYVMVESDRTGASIRYPGKGGVDCSSGKIAVWSEGRPSS